MRRALFLLAAVLTVCFWRRRHGHAKRTPLGGYRCEDCRRPFADLAEAGQMDEGAYVSPVRRGAVREPGWSAVERRVR